MQHSLETSSQLHKMCFNIFSVFSFAYNYYVNLWNMILWSGHFRVKSCQTWESSLFSDNNKKTGCQGQFGKPDRLELFAAHTQKCYEVFCSVLGAYRMYSRWWQMHCCFTGRINPTEITPGIFRSAEGHSVHPQGRISEKGSYKAATTKSLPPLPPSFHYLSLPILLCLTHNHITMQTQYINVSWRWGYNTNSKSSKTFNCVQCRE